MHAPSLDASSLLPFFRAQLEQQQPILCADAHGLALLSPHPTSPMDAMEDALHALKQDGTIAAFRLLKTPSAHAFLVELAPAD